MSVRKYNFPSQIPLNSLAIQRLITKFESLGGGYGNPTTLAIGYMTALLNYNPKKEYGFVRYDQLPQQATIQNLRFAGVLEIVEEYIAGVQCYRYVPDLTDRDQLIDDLLADSIVITPEVATGKYQEVVNPLRSGIRVLANPKNTEAANWIKINLVLGTLAKTTDPSILLFTPKYYRAIDAEERFYELGAGGYQTLTNKAKSALMVRGQQNMDIRSCHKAIAIGLDSAIEQVMAFAGATKEGVLSLLNGSGIELARKQMPEAAMDCLVRAKSVVMKLAKKMSTRSGKLWRIYQKQEQAWIKQITDYLDSIGVGYLNMHDGLMVDERVDYAGLGLEFEWVEKSLD